jgi:beta-mannosidase
MLLDEGWEAAAAAPGADPGDWLPARVPGTAAGALRDAGLWRPGESRDLDAEDWWFRARFGRPQPGETLLRLRGVATVAEIRLNGALLLESRSMFLEHEVDVGSLLADDNELTIRCRALRPLLDGRRSPRARWRTRIADDANLRFFRTAILGRSSGIAPAPAAVGPWRPVSIEAPSPLRRVRLRPWLAGADGRIDVDAPAGVEAECAGARAVEGTIVLPGVERWWPHTHGEPVLYDVTLRSGDEELVRRVGFRTLESGRPLEEGLALEVNGTRVFARGCVWTPVDFVGHSCDDDALRRALEQVRDAGMNVLRLAGTGFYESERFHDLCDELGILVWQDVMLANFDYPLADEDFRAELEEEVRQLLRRIGGRPSTAVICGASEVEQQVAMLGLDPALARGELYDELLPGLVAESGADAVWLPSSPTGGTLPFHTDSGVAHYWGVGGWRRPLGDARRADVRFASECLAFANVPADAVADALAPVHLPRWKAGVPRDNGSPWDFDDVRDHYLRELYGFDPAELRRFDQARYLELSRHVSGEVMAEVVGEWRRRDSRCEGAIVLALRDLVPGAGWGLVDSDGSGKVALSHVRRVFAPVAVWTTDEGVNGIDVHVANDRPQPLDAQLRVELFRAERLTGEAETRLSVDAAAVARLNVEGLLGRFVDAAWSHRFGPPGHDAVVVSLVDPGGALLSQSFRFPAGRPLELRPPEQLGLAGRVEDGRLVVHSEGLAYGVRLHAAGVVPADDAFCVAPGGERAVPLAGEWQGGVLTALNLDGRVRVE